MRAAIGAKAGRQVPPVRLNASSVPVDRPYPAVCTMTTWPVPAGRVRNRLARFPAGGAAGGCGGAARGPAGPGGAAPGAPARSAGKSVLDKASVTAGVVVVDGGSSVGRVPSGPGAARASGAAGPVAGRAGGPVPVGRPTSAIPSSSAASAPATAANAVPVRRLVSMPPGR